MAEGIPLIMKSTLIKTLIVLTAFAALAGCGKNTETALKPMDNSRPAPPLDPAKVAIDKSHKATDPKALGGAGMVAPGGGGAMVAPGAGGAMVAPGGSAPMAAPGR
jgi:hypothetical protein